MRNNKGFTLMELLAALFIGGMVTAALVLVWKTASVQTSQGQRQTIIRNQVSSFIRQIYRDFYAADIIADPPENTDDNVLTVLLTGLKKARRINDLQYIPYHQNSNPEGPTKAFIYCLVNNSTIKRYETVISYNASNPVETLYANGVELASTIATSLGTICSNNGTTVLTDFNLDKVKRGTDGQYSLRGVVRKTFKDVTGTTPIIVEINETLLESGGM